MGESGLRYFVQAKISLTRNGDGDTYEIYMIGGLIIGLVTGVWTMFLVTRTVPHRLWWFQWIIFLLMGTTFTYILFRLDYLEKHQTQWIKCIEYKTASQSAIDCKKE